MAQFQRAWRRAEDAVRSRLQPFWFFLTPEARAINSARQDHLASLALPIDGRRVLEVGAGIGTITREIEAGLELLIALEVDRFYVQRLQNLFRGKPHVRPLLSGVEQADWARLAINLALELWPPPVQRPRPAHRPFPRRPP